MTGSNTGVGKELAKILYSTNGTVYIACRSEAKAQEAIESIQSAHPASTGGLHFLKLDLSDLTTIQASADEFLSKESRLDFLCNNAGVMIPPVGSTSAQGYELQYGTNILGPFLFTTLLLPVLRQTARTRKPGEVRVSWAASSAVHMSPPRGMGFQDDGSLAFSTLGGTTEYAVSKCANYFLASEFGRRFGSADGVLHNVRRHFGPVALRANIADRST